MTVDEILSELVEVIDKNMEESSRKNFERIFTVLVKLNVYFIDKIILDKYPKQKITLLDDLHGQCKKLLNVFEEDRLEKISKSH